METQKKHGEPYYNFSQNVNGATNKHNESYCEMQMKAKMQNNSVAPSALVIMATSMPFFSTSQDYLHMYQINFHFACIIGAFIGAFVVRKISKNSIQIAISTLTIASGIIISALPTSYIYVIIFRYMQGLSFGAATIIVIVSASEIAQSKYRGLIASLEVVSISTGIFTYSIISSCLVSNKDLLDDICGYLTIAFGSVALITIFISVESPLYLLLQNKENDALMAVQKLQKEESLSTDVYKQLYDIKDFLADDKTRTLNQNFKEGIVPFIKIATIRCLNALTYNSLIITTIINNSESYIMAFFGSGRWIAVLLTNLFMIESVGRRKLLVSACLMSTANLFVITLVSFGTTASYVWIPMIFLQFFNGFGQVSASVYIGEAFSVSVKPFYAFFILALEKMVQIIVLVAYYDVYSLSLPYYASLSILFACAIPFSVYMFPETAGLSLKGSRWKFLNWITK